MTVSFRTFWLQLTGLLAVATLHAQASGIIKADRTNVRAKPAFDGEVLATLNKGDAVEVLDQVPGTGSDGTPRPWAKIALPKQTQVWVYGPLVDPKTKAVKSKVLNLRAGPGRNYSELGELSQGTTVTVLREVDGWLLIEPPPSTFGFVSASLIEVTAPAAPAPVVQTAPPIPAPVAETKPAAVQPRPQPQLPVVPPVFNEPAPQPATAAPAPVASNVVPTTTTPAPAAVAAAPAPEVLADPGTNAPAKPRKFRSFQPGVRSVPEDREFTATGTDDTKPREVLREGMVGRAWSVQAPGYHELVSLSKEGNLDFLISETPDIDLTKYRGHHVLVSGEEWRDSRWKTPLLKVKSIQLAD